MTSSSSSSADHGADSTLLWCTNINEIKASGATSSDTAEWDFLLNTLNTMDKEKTLSFLYEDDQKRSLVSVMLQRAMIRNRFDFIDDTKYAIVRTTEVSFSSLYE